MLLSQTRTPGDSRRRFGIYDGPTEIDTSLAMIHSNFDRLGVIYRAPIVSHLHVCVPTVLVIIRKVIVAFGLFRPDRISEI